MLELAAHCKAIHQAYCGVATPPLQAGRVQRLSAEKLQQLLKAEQAEKADLEQRVASLEAELGAAKSGEYLPHVNQLLQ